MALKDVVKVSRKTFIDPCNWLGYDVLKGQTRTLFGLAKTSLTAGSKPQGPEETFEEAMQRLDVNEADLKEILLNYSYFTWIFVLLGAVGIIAALYLLFVHFSFAGFLLASCVTTLFFAQAFRYSFFAFQIKHRKLGCTFAEWKSGTLNNP